MPITTNQRIPGGNVNDRVGSWRFFPIVGGAQYSHPFRVTEQPVALIGKDIVSTFPVQVQFTPDNGTTWQNFWLNDLSVHLTSTNTLLILRVAGTYRLF